MTLSGSVGRWHGSPVVSPEERRLRNEIARDEELLAEWIGKRDEAIEAVRRLRESMKKLRAKAERAGIALP